MIISISGTPGAGKSTIAKMIAEELRLKRYYMGGIIRKMAQEKGMTLDEFYGQDENVDKEIDDYLVQLGKEEDNFIVEGRTAFHFIPHSIKLYLDVNLKEGANRIFEEMKQENRRNERKYHDADEALEVINKRLAKEAEQYGKLYNLDVHDKNHYDFVLNTTVLTVNEVKEKLLNFIRQYNE
ncbi:MAG: cytidylate kinase family protein [Nanoarchaeota archaeon]|nr:cytidylate kinase family protein [Nanoarchaeota archaeon]MCG2718207.1 cytidylate kinase family protein [Nanoarchaeota archaeon]